MPIFAFYFNLRENTSKKKNAETCLCFINANMLFNKFIVWCFVTEKLIKKFNY